MDGIITEGLTLGYGAAPVISGLNISIPKGKITSIIGANGCGKSTLLKSMARILTPDSGRVLIDGDDVHKLSPKKIAKKMAVLPQAPKAPSGLSVRELVSYGRFPHKSGFGALTKEDNRFIEESMEIAGISELKNKALDELSGGQRQRAWIAMALCQKTDILILDEPTTYLDLAHQFDVLSLLSGLNKERGCTIVMVLHEINHASRFSDNILAMKTGKVVASGTPKEVITSENLCEVFGIDAELIEDRETGRPMYLTYGKHV